MLAGTGKTPEEGEAASGFVPGVPARPPAHKWGAEERALQEVFAERREAVHLALCDSIDTPAALKAMEQIIRATNTCECTGVEHGWCHR